MYTLYFDKYTKEIKVSKARKALQNLNFTEEVTAYNQCYYICSKRKPLIEEAKEIQRQWIEELEEELKTLKEIKF